MQYRTSTLVALFSATTALAYLDCGGGRAPPKTTVPGCPGYIDPATVVPTSTSASSYYSTQYDTGTIITSTTTAQSSVITDVPEVAVDSNAYYSMYEDTDAASGCNCRGYLCQYATPGCVNLDASSTITANSGWETKTFDEEAYYSFIQTASSAGGELSIDGYRIELVTAVPSSSGHAGSTTTKTKQASTTATGSATGSESATGAAATTMATSTLAASSQAASNSSSNATASSTSVAVADTNSASKISGMASLAALLVSGAAAIVML